MRHIHLQHALAAMAMMAATPALAQGPDLLQEDALFKIECNAKSEFNAQVADARALLPWATVVGMEDLLRQGQATKVAGIFDRISDAMAPAVVAKCASGKTKYFRATVAGSDFKSNGNLFWGEYDVTGRQWRHRQYNVDTNYRVEQSRLNDLSQPAALADLAKRTSGDVVEPNVLWQNPWVYRDKVVVLRTVFGRMIDQDHAAFELNHEVHVSGVPATKFRTNGEVALVAVKVTGSEKVRNFMGEYAVPTATYVEGLNCADLKCGLW